MSRTIDLNPLLLDANDLFIAFRFPGEKDYHLMISDSISEAENTFIIHPFEKESSSPEISISSAQILANQPFQFETSQKCNVGETSKDKYLSAANNLIDSMRKKELTKVVLSRTKYVEAAGVDLFGLFQNLIRTYKTAFVFFYNIPGEGTWMGVTPETLYEEQNSRASTVALAATQKVDGRESKEVHWNTKEQEEQAIIQRFIESKFDLLNIDYQKGTTHTAQAGNVFHIKTEYSFPITNSSTLLDNLHPGPAICGVPQEKALEAILNSEDHKRAYYCGYLGLQSTSKTRLFINLRSMQVFNDKFVLYVGGGLTADSQAESEWEETVVKSKTLESVIQKSYIYAHDV